MIKHNLSFLPSNPFFSKIISLGDNFGAEGELLLFLLLKDTISLKDSIQASRMVRPTQAAMCANTWEIWNARYTQVKYLPKLSKYPSVPGRI